MTDCNATTNYLVAGSKSWNRRAFSDVLACRPGRWHYVSSPENLTVKAIQRLAPRYIFFLHWSWKVPAEITGAYECVAFHMTDLPFGRGGSPLQNLILRGHTETSLSALRMTQELDAGPVYLKRDLALDGTAQEILERTTQLAAEMIDTILTERLAPRPQVGEITVFRRRRPEDSEIPDGLAPAELYDFVRMLDAEGYPAAFVRVGSYRYELRNAILRDGRLTADVTVILEGR